MGIELDHIFVCVAEDAPEAERFIQFGLREGPSNRHPGQGTANRRFFFENAMLELLWVSDAAEADSEATRRTLLWERWSGRRGAACPFGICVRPSDSEAEKHPFPGWEYRPSYLPDPLSLHLGETGVDEPMWIYMSFQRKAYWEERFNEHPIGIRQITGAALTHLAPLRSGIARTMVRNGVLSSRVGPAPLLEIEYDGARRKQIADFRPQLPLVFHF
jgi:hypothetical protein